jgi:hypothetical protein
MARVHTPNIEAAIPILTHVVMMPVISQLARLSRPVIKVMSNITRSKKNCLATPMMIDARSRYRAASTGTRAMGLDE